MESKGVLIACHVHLEVFGILRDHSMCGGKQSPESQLVLKVVMAIAGNRLGRCLAVELYIYTHLFTYIHTFIYIYMHDTYIYRYVYVYLYLFLCLYLYLYTCISLLTDQHGKPWTPAALQNFLTAFLARTSFVQEALDRFWMKPVDWPGTIW